MTLSAAPRQSVPEVIIERILQAISSGDIRPGERLPTEPELARSLGVGRTSVREALGKLQMLGVIEVRRGLGTFVTNTTTTDPKVAFLRWSAEHSDQVIDLFEVRMALEAAAAALAAVRANAAERRALLAAARRHGEVADDGLDPLVATDQEFHQLLVDASHNEALQRVYAMLVPQFYEYRKKSLALRGAPERSASDHLSIVTAIQARAPEQARAAVLAHLATLYAEVLDMSSKPTRKRATARVPIL